MKRVFFTIILTSLSLQAHAASVTANATLTRGTVIGSGDVTVKIEQGESRDDVLRQYIGKEMKRTVYGGYKINLSFVGDPVLVKRNTRVNMVYNFGSMEISAWGRALDEGAAGEIITVMNLESRNKIQGTVMETGIIKVSP